jgi:single-strand DNA-binding protein
MTGTVNRAILMGNVGRAPDVRNTQYGDKIANFSVATSESWVDKQSGERREKTEWHRVAVFNQHLVGVVEKYIKKGTRLYIEGTVQTREWTGQDGVKRHTTEVVVPKFGDYKMVILSTHGRSDDAYEPREATGTDPKGNPKYAGRGSDLDDEIPF